MKAGTSYDTADEEQTLLAVLVLPTIHTFPHCHAHRNRWGPSWKLPRSCKAPGEASSLLQRGQRPPWPTCRGSHTRGRISGDGRTRARGSTAEGEGGGGVLWQESVEGGNRCRGGGGVLWQSRRCCWPYGWGLPSLILSLQQRLRSAPHRIIRDFCASETVLARSEH